MRTLTSLSKFFLNLERIAGIPPGQEGRNARFAFYFLIAGGITFIIYIPVFLLLENWPLVAGMVIGTLGCIVGLYNIVRGEARRAAIIAVSIGFFMINFNTFFVGGVFSVGDLFLIPTTIIAWIIFGHQVGLRLAGLSILCTLAHCVYFLAFGSSYDLPLIEGSGAHAILVAAFKVSLQLIVFVLIFLFSYLMNRSLNEIETLHGSLSAMLETDSETAIAIFDSNYQLIEGSASKYFKQCFSAHDLIQLIKECTLEQSALVHDVLNTVYKQNSLTWILNEASLPRSALIRGKRHKLEWKPVFQRDMLDRIIFMAHSIEDLFQAQQKADEQMEEAHRLLLLVSLGSGRVTTFVERARLQIQEAKRYAEAKDIRHSFIALHTLKGASRMLGFTALSEGIHELETQLPESKPKDFEPVEREFGKIESSCRSLGYTQDALTISRQAAQKALDDNMSQQFLLDLIYPTVENLILSYQIDIEKLARNLGRPVPHLDLPRDCSRIYMSQEAKHSLNQSLIHIFRNTLDHSIEPADIRLQLGKPSTPSIVVTLTRCHDGVELGFCDDGRGLNLEKIRAKARALGYATESMNPQDLAEIIFHPGFTTVEAVNQVSGRGVGMDAIRAAMQTIGGQAKARILTHQGEYCSWELLLFLPAKECINSKGSAIE